MHSPFIAVKMSHQASKDKPRSSKCHFCLPFDSHNYCPACREANNEGDPCVTLEKPCEICSGFSEELLLKIKNRHRYVRKQKATDTSKDDDLDLLGDEDVESFSGSHADLEDAADNLFVSPPHHTTSRILVRTAETSFFVIHSINPVWYISLGEYKEFSIYIARKLNNIHNMCNLFF